MPSGLGRRTLAFVLHTCQKKQISPSAIEIAHDTPPPLSFRISGDSTPVLRETDVCRLVIGSQEHVPALRIGSACGWARGESGYAPRNYVRLLTLRHGTPFTRE